MNDMVGFTMEGEDVGMKAVEDPDSNSSISVIWQLGNPTTDRRILESLP